MPDDTLAAIATELYAQLPAEFIAARDARTRALRDDGRRELAAEVKALRRPTTAAWLVNLLAHRAGTLDPLADLGRRLRDAQSQLDAPAMKELAGRRPRVVAELVEEAVRRAGERDPAFQDTPSTREQVTATLTAALADPRAEDAVASGRLVTALAYAGFGEVEIGDAVATPLRAVPDTPQRRSAGGAGTPSTPDDPPEPEPPAGPTEAELETARRRVAEAAATLEVAEAALAQARARRAAARRAWESADAALEDLQDR